MHSSLPSVPTHFTSIASLQMLSMATMSAHFAKPLGRRSLSKALYLLSILMEERE